MLGGLEAIVDTGLLGVDFIAPMLRSSENEQWTNFVETVIVAELASRPVVGAVDVAWTCDYRMHLVLSLPSAGSI